MYIYIYITEFIFLLADLVDADKERARLGKMQVIHIYIDR